MQPQGRRTLSDPSPSAESGRGVLLSPTQVRELAARLGVHPAKSKGQNFVVDPGTVRRIAARSGVRPGEVVLEVGPGLGSLTLALLERGASVTAVELDAALATALPETVHARLPDAPLRVLRADALTLTGPHDLPGPAPTALVANLPYNVAVPVLLTMMERLPSLERVLVMVQAEVADRLTAPPGSRTYGVPSVKLAWYGQARPAGAVARSVFWPVPRVDSSLVEVVRHDPPSTSASREDVFALVDAAFAQRRKTLRAALATWAGSSARAEELLRAAGIDPGLRGERLSVGDFATLARGID